MKIDKLCHGQECYLRLFCCTNDPATVVPAHANEIKLGKGKGIKANDIYTVPACYSCHKEIDQGKALSKSERRIAWRKAYNAWAVYRKQHYGIEFEPLPEE